MGFKDAVMAILSLADLNTIRKKLRGLVDSWEAIYEERRRTQYEKENDIIYLEKNINKNVTILEIDYNPFLCNLYNSF